MKFTHDHHLRAKYLVDTNLDHPTRMHLGIVWECVERYSKPGDWIYDPMGGVGTTLFGAVMGRNVVVSDIEPRFVTVARKNIISIQATSPMLGYETGVMGVLLADGRSLPIASSRFDLIITSPPYLEAMFGGGIAVKGMYNDAAMADRVYSAANMPSSPGNIASMKGKDHENALLDVYRESHRILKDNGICILVVKNVIRHGEQIDLVNINTHLMEQAGFRVLEQLERRFTNLSFWRTLQKRKGLPVPEQEWVTAYVH